MLLKAKENFLSFIRACTTKNKVFLYKILHPLQFFRGVILGVPVIHVCRIGAYSTFKVYSPNYIYIYRIYIFTRQSWISPFYYLSGWILENNFLVSAYAVERKCNPKFIVLWFRLYWYERSRDVFKYTQCCALSR